MRRPCWVVLVLLWTPTGVWADALQVLAAEQAVAAGNYPLAVQNYERVLKQDGFSAPVLFNLGNAWLRLGKPAQAILEYERALVLEPRSAAIEANLATAQQRAGVAAAAEGPWLTAARYFSFDTYAWTAFASIWVLCGALVLLSLNGAQRRLARPLILAAAVALCVSADAAALCWSDLSRAVVQVPAALHLAPATSAAVSTTLHEGEVVWLQDHYAGFNLVRTREGRTGWISADTALPVRIPRP